MSRGRLLFAFYHLCMLIIKIRFANGTIYFFFFYFISGLIMQFSEIYKSQACVTALAAFPKYYSNS